MPNNNFKCDHCKKQFISFQDGEDHHKQSRHKKKPLAIVEMVSDRKEITFENFEDGLSGSDEDPDFSHDEDEIRLKVKKSRFKKRKIVPEEPPKTASPRKRGRVSSHRVQNNAFREEKPKEEPISLSKNSELVPSLYYKCIKCNKWFDTYRDLSMHQVEEYQDDSIKLHIATERGGAQVNPKFLTRYFCFICSLKAFSREEIAHHWQTHPYPNLNAQPFKYYQLEPNSTIKLEEVPTYKCSKCTVIPDTLDILKAHWIEKHTPDPVKVVRLYGIESHETFTCNICSKGFPYRDMNTIHQKEEH